LEEYLSLFEGHRLQDPTVRAIAEAENAQRAAFREEIINSAT
jgi:hypothetical protein